jgi:hypothetical protein
VRLWRARPCAGDRLELGIDTDARGWLQLIDGRGVAFGCSLERGDGVGFSPCPGEVFEAGENGADLLLFEVI